MLWSKLKKLLKAKYLLRPKESSYVILDRVNSDLLSNFLNRSQLRHIVLDARFETIYLQEFLAAVFTQIGKFFRREKGASLSAEYFAQLVRRVGASHVFASQTHNVAFYELATLCPGVEFRFVQHTIIDDAIHEKMSDRLGEIEIPNVTCFLLAPSNYAGGYLGSVTIGNEVVFGSPKNNVAPRAHRTKRKHVVCLVSQYRRQLELSRESAGPLLGNHVDAYPLFLREVGQWISSCNFELEVVLANKNSDIRDEVAYLDRHLGLACRPLERFVSFEENYLRASSYHLLIGYHSTLLFEMAAIGKRVAICPPEAQLHNEASIFWRAVMESDQSDLFVARTVDSVRPTLTKSFSATQAETRAFSEQIRRKVLALPDGFVRGDAWTRSECARLALTE